MDCGSHWLQQGITLRRWTWRAVILVGTGDLAETDTSLHRSTSRVVRQLILNMKRFWYSQKQTHCWLLESRNISAADIYAERRSLWFEWSVYTKKYTTSKTASSLSTYIHICLSICDARLKVGHNLGMQGSTLKESLVK